MMWRGRKEEKGRRLGRRSYITGSRRVLTSGHTACCKLLTVLTSYDGEPSTLVSTLEATPSLLRVSLEIEQIDPGQDEPCLANATEGDCN